MKIPQNKRITRLGLAAMAASSLFLTTQAGIYTNNFNADPSGTLTILDPAKWVDSGGVDGTGYISITDAINSLQGGIIIEDLDAGATVGGFQADFMLRIGGGSGNPADGFSFNFASDLPDATMSEEGTGTGFTAAFDIYDNGGGEAPAIDLKVGGVVVQSVKFAKADILTDDVGGFAPVHILYRNGLLTLDYKGKSVYKDVAIGLPPIAGGRFGIGARTGGENANQWIDNLRIETFLLTAPAIAGVTSDPKGVTIRLQDSPNSAVNASSVKLTVDGVAATGGATKSGDITLISFTNSALYASGTVHPVVLTYTHGTPAVNATNSFSFTTPAYTLITASAALPAGSVDTTKRGFSWRVHQADASLATSVQRAEDQLAGLLGDNIADPNAQGDADGVAAAANPTTAPLNFTVSKVINFDQFAGSANGNFTPDLQMPGIPGVLGGDDNIAAEILTALEFPAPGSYTMIVNSDDGFRTTAGYLNPRDVVTPQLGIFDAGRGASDTAFNFYVEAAGLYAFRTVWFEGGGGANVEWLTQKANGTKVLLNDTDTDPQAVKAYQIPAAALPAYVRSVKPASGSKTLNSPKTVEATIVDGGTTVTASSVSLKLNGQTVNAVATKTGTITKVVFTPTGDLLPSTEYTADLTYSDTKGPRTVTWKFTTGPLSSTVFVIEAEDFDVDGTANPQKGVAGLDVDVMPYLGGAYDTLGGTEQIDFVNSDGPDSDVYRTEIGDDGDHEVNISTDDGVAGGNGLDDTISLNSSDRGAWTMTRNYRIGWVGTGEWQNYTRNFPSDNGQHGWWKVWAALSYAGDQPGQLSGSLDKVTDGVGTTSQTVERLGQFSARGSGGWGNNNLVPMKTASGDIATVKLTGKNTVRFNLGSGDFDFVIFSAAPPPPPTVDTVPQDSALRDAVILDWTLKDTDTKVATSSVKVFFDGNDVTSKATVTKTATGATVHLDLSGTLQAAGEHPWRLTFSDDGSPAQNVSATGNFVVAPYPATSVFVIEAEDFNYSDDGIVGGKTNPQKGVDGMDVDKMPYLGGAYNGLSAVKGIDYVNADGNDSDVYRTELDANGENEVNIGDNLGGRYGADRGAFQVTANYKIGWVATGEWQDYTRTFPAGDYNVWAALSYDGRAPGQLSGSLDLVTSDPTKSGQTVKSLGTFSAPGSGGWGRNELVPMKGTNGTMATVTMGGVQTVRFNLGSGDFDYFVFVPTTGGGPAPRITSIKSNSNGSVTIEWTGGGTLQAAPTVTGPWSDVQGATSPYNFTPTAAQKVLFGRIRQ